MGVALGSSSTQESYANGHPAGERKGWEPQYKKQQLDIYFTNDTTAALIQPLYATDESGTGWKQSYVYGNCFLTLMSRKRRCFCFILA